MSTAASPSSETDPSAASERSVTRDRISFESCINTSTRSPMNSIPVTDPTSTPATRTGAPSLRPGTLSNTVLSAYRCQKKPPSPLTMTISVAAITRAKTEIRPILSSDQARERVRGIDIPLHLLEELANVRIGLLAQFVRVAFDQDAAVLQHDELGFIQLPVVGGFEPELPVVANRLVPGHIERITKLVRHQNRADILEIAQLHDLI